MSLLPHKKFTFKTLNIIDKVHMKFQKPLIKAKLTSNIRDLCDNEISITIHNL